MLDAYIVERIRRERERERERAKESRIPLRIEQPRVRPVDDQPPDDSRPNDGSIVIDFRV